MSQNSSSYDIEDISFKDEEISEKDIKIRRIELDSSKLKNQKKITIQGIPVYFPYEPYKSQIKYMEKVIEACKTKNNAALESPTGTGKTLCLLCSSLAYLKYLREQMIKDRKDKKQYSDNIKQPIIYYTSRTHSQLSNAINELKKTCYRPVNSFVCSRDKICVNDEIANLKHNDLYQKCEYAINHGKCPYFSGKLVNQKWYKYDNKTINEMKIIGKKQKFCPFYYEKEKCQNSDIIFLPYNYIFDNKIFKRMPFDISNSILIVDEGHNIPQTCSDSFSIDLNTNLIEAVMHELKTVKNDMEDDEINNNNNLLQTGISNKEIEIEIKSLSNINKNIKTLEIGKNGKEINNDEFFEILFNNDNKINENEINENKNNEEITDDGNNNEDINNNVIEEEFTPKNLGNHITFLIKVSSFIIHELNRGTLISELVDSLNIIKSIVDSHYNNDTPKKDNIIEYISNFRFFVENINKPKGKILHLFCFNPGLGFNEVVSKNPLSIIITSGTLSPINGIESELEMEFKVKLENNHVIDKRQLLFCGLNASIFDKKINFTFNYENRAKDEIKKEIGLILLEFCKVTPGGILIFFCSYSLMSEYIDNWKKKENNKSIYDEIAQYKKIFIDKRDEEKNKKLLEDYYKINTNTKNNEGGLLLSVCRGICSEGMDFKDDYARLVIVIGIPFANLKLPKIYLKKNFQEEYNKLISSNEEFDKPKKLSWNIWYLQDAMRTVNQSLGRVIRHAYDYGCMILVDSRYNEYRNHDTIDCIPFWMRSQFKSYYDETIFEDIDNFFKKSQNLISDLKNKKLSRNKNIKNNTSNKENKKENILSFLNEKKEELEKEEEEESNSSFKKEIEFISASQLIKSKNIKKSEHKYLLNIIDKIKNDEEIQKKLDEEGISLIDDISNRYVCKICYVKSEKSDVKFKLEKNCGYVCCENCWKKIEENSRKENKEMRCPNCRKNIKLNELNQLLV